MEKINNLPESKLQRQQSLEKLMNLKLDIPQEEWRFSGLLQQLATKMLLIMEHCHGLHSQLRNPSHELGGAHLTVEQLNEIVEVAEALTMAVLNLNESFAGCIKIAVRRYLTRLKLSEDQQFAELQSPGPENENFLYLIEVKNKSHQILQAALDNLCQVINLTTARLYELKAQDQSKGSDQKDTFSVVF